LCYYKAGIDTALLLLLLLLLLVLQSRFMSWQHSTASRQASQSSRCSTAAARASTCWCLTSTWQEQQQQQEQEQEQEQGGRAQKRVGLAEAPAAGSSWGGQELCRSCPSESGSKACRDSTGTWQAQHRCCEMCAANVGGSGSCAAARRHCEPLVPAHVSDAYVVVPAGRSWCWRSAGAPTRV
jgi:hypothetical protein